MTGSTRTEKELTTKANAYFGGQLYVVSYDLDPVNHHSINRQIVIDEVPGKLSQFFGKKTVRRTFVGRIDWYEILDDRRIKCPKQMSISLSETCERLEKKSRQILRAKRRKAETER